MEEDDYDFEQGFDLPAGPVFKLSSNSHYDSVSDSHYNWDTDGPAFTISQPIKSTDLEQPEEDWDKQTTLKAKQVVSSQALEQLAAYHNVSGTGAGAVQHLGTHMLHTGSDIADDDSYNLQQLTLKTPATVTSHIPDKVSQVGRSGKSSVSSLSSHSEADNENMETGFELDSQLDKLVLSKGSSKATHSRESSAASATPSCSSSVSSLSKASPSSLLVANGRAKLSKPRSSFGTTVLSTSTSSSSKHEDEDAAFFEEIEVPPWLAGNSETGQEDPGTQPLTTESLRKLDLQSMLQAKLASRAAAEQAPLDPFAPKPFHDNTAARKRQELFEEGLEIDDASFAKEPASRTLARAPPSHSKRVLTHARSVVSLKTRTFDTSPPLPSYTSQNTLKAPIQRTLKYKKSTPALHHTSASSTGFEELKSHAGRTLARKMSMPALPRLELGPSATQSRSNLRPGTRQPPMSPPLPPSRPSTPAASSAALRLTMPTLSSKAKQRSVSTSVDPSGTVSSVMVGSTVAFRGLMSPLGHKHGQSVTSISTSTATYSAPSTGTGAGLLRRPKRQHAYGDGTELDQFDDLPTNKDKEGRFTKRPANRRAVSGDTLTPQLTPRPRYGSVAAAMGRKPSLLNMQMDMKQDMKQDVKQDTNQVAGIKRKKKHESKAQPHLIRNLGNSTTSRVEGDMVWNPVTMKWEGNEGALQAFDNVLASSARPALITQFTTGIHSPMSTRSTPWAATTAGLGGVRVVGNMVFDPVKMAWFNLESEESDELDFGDDEQDAGCPQPQRPVSRVDWSSNADAIRLSGKASFASGASNSTTRGGRPDSDSERDAFFRTCRLAVQRHSQEMKGWPPWDPDVQSQRSHLWTIRSIIMQQQQR